MLASPSFTATIPEHRVERVQELVNRIALRFDREGLPRPHVRWGASRKDNRLGWVRDVSIDDPMPRLPGGWFVIAALDHIEGGNVIHARSDESLEAYRDVPARCEHCNTTRRRKRTFVLENEKGERVQVGADCLEAFTGRPDILRVVAGFALLLMLERDIMGLVGDEGEGGGGGGASEFRTLRVATEAASIVRTVGWVSRRQAEEQGISATADAVVAVLSGRARSQATPEDEAHARAAIQWAQHLSDADVAESKGDYLHNIRVLARNEYIHWRHIATVCSIVPAYDRWRAQQGAGQHLDEWAGEVGATVSWGVPPEITKKGTPKPGTWTQVGAWVVIEGTTSLASAYGEKTLIRFRDDKGRALVWFATGRKVGLPVGERVGLIGTVKKHEVYQGKKQTTLTRAVIRELRKENPRKAKAAKPAPPAPAPASWSSDPNQDPGTAPAPGPMFTEAEVASRMAALRAAWAKCPPKPGMHPQSLQRIEKSFRTLPWEDDPSEQARFLAWYAEQVDPERCAKLKAKARERAREERLERAWERQGVNVEDDIGLRGRGALDRALRGKSVWVYHGTSSTQLPEILKHGLSFDESRKFPETTPGVYLTAKPGHWSQTSGAGWYARRAAHQFGGDPVVLRILMPYAELEWDSDDEDIESGNYQWRTDYVPPSAILEVNGERVVRGARAENPAKPRSGPWYTGTYATIDRFTLEHVGRGNDQLGAGLYFTSSRENASHYGTNVYEVSIRWKKVVTNPWAPMPTSLLDALLRAGFSSREWLERDAEDWDPDVHVAERMVRSAHRGFSWLEVLIKLPGSFSAFNARPVEMLSVLVAAGYTGMVVPSGSTIQGSSGLSIEWAVVWDASAVENRGAAREPNPAGPALAAQILAVVTQLRQDGYEHFGLRVDERKMPSGRARPSREWSDGKRTRRVLTGTSTVGIHPLTLEGVERALERLGPYRHIGDYVSLIAGHDAHLGADPHEVLISGIRAGVWRSALPRSENPAPAADVDAAIVKAFRAAGMKVPNAAAGAGILESMFIARGYTRNKWGKLVFTKPDGTELRLLLQPQVWGIEKRPNGRGEWQIIEKRPIVESALDFVREAALAQNDTAAVAAVDKAPFLR